MRINSSVASTGTMICIVLLQGPVVSLDRPSLSFGLIPLGRSASLRLTVVNESKCAVKFQLKQLTESADECDKEEESHLEGNNVTDHSCLEFEPSSGDLGPYGSRTVSVRCCPVATGRLRSMAVCLVNGKTHR